MPHSAMARTDRCLDSIAATRARIDAKAKRTPWRLRGSLTVATASNKLPERITSRAGGGGDVQPCWSPAAAALANQELVNRRQTGIQTRPSLSK